jgi:hypothetical protein
MRSERHSLPHNGLAEIDNAESGDHCGGIARIPYKFVIASDLRDVISVSAVDGVVALAAKLDVVADPPLIVSCSVISIPVSSTRSIG